MSLARRFVSVALLSASACGHAPKPPAAPRAAHWSRSLLAETARGVTGDQRDVVDGVWCAKDRVFSLPIAPFPEGPTELYGEYLPGGVTSTLDMVDANDSVLEIARTRIRHDLASEDVLPGVASKLERSSRVIPSLRFEWVQQGGRTQLESVNPMENYTGREDIVYLSLSSGSSNDPSGPCRVDRHLVGDGYYFQIIAVANRPKAPAGSPSQPDACAFASELAAWTAEHLCIGASCCADSPQKGVTTGAKTVRPTVSSPRP